MSQRTIQISFFSVLTIGLLVLSFFIFRPYLAVIGLAAILSVTFYPLYERLLPRFKRKGSAAFLTLLIIVLIIIIPLILFSTVLLRESVDLYNGVAFSGGAERLILAANSLISRFESLLSIQLISSNLELTTYTRDVLGWVISHFDSVLAAVFNGLFKFVLLLLSLYYMLIYGGEIRKSVVLWSPLPDNYDNEFLDRLRRSVDAVVRGRLLVSAAQGFFLGLGFYIFGIPSPVLWGFIGALASLIPVLGTSLITVPAALYLFITGHVAAGIGIAVWGAVLVGLIDNVLSFFFFKGKIDVHPLVVLFAILGGVELFGVLGFLFGPVIVSAFLTLVRMYPYIMSKGESSRTT